MTLSSDGRQEWADAYASARTPSELFRALRDWFYPRVKMRDPKKVHFVNREDGPMMFLGLQIVKRMERAGYPSIIHACFRHPAEQQRVFDKGASKARPWESPHQYFEAVDIVHKSLYWQAPPVYWETLATVVRQVAEEFGVPLEHGHHWKFVDSAHVEMKDWRSVRKAQLDRVGVNYRPSKIELKARFAQVLPKYL